MDVRKSQYFPQKAAVCAGQQIEISTLQALRHIIEANNARGTQTTLTKLENLNVELEVLRSLLRVAFELKFIKAASLGFITKKIDEVGKMGGSWQKKARSHATS